MNKALDRLEQLNSRLILAYQNDCIKESAYRDIQHEINMLRKEVKNLAQPDVLSSLLPSKERVEVSNMVMKILTENTHIVDGQVRGVIVHGAVEKLTDIIMEMRKQIA